MSGGLDRGRSDPAPLGLTENHPISGLRALVGRALRQPCSKVLGVEGSAGLLFAVELARATEKPLLYVTSDQDAARRAHDDLGYLLRRGYALDPSRFEPLLLPSAEESPWASVRPERRQTMERLAVLSRLGRGGAPLLVTSAAALLRRVLPPELVRQHCLVVEVGQSLDPRSLAEQCVQMGYLRLPVVDQMGTVATRGGLVDLWSPDAPAPVRVEIDGDEVVSLRSFDPDTQRSLGAIERASVVLAREAIVTPENTTRVKERLRALCDRFEWPSSKARRLVEEISSGQPSLGSAGYLPAFYDLVPLWHHLPEESHWVIEDAPAVVAALVAEFGTLDASKAVPREAPAFDLETLIVSEAELRWRLRKGKVVSLLRFGQVGHAGDDDLSFLELVDPETPTLGSHEPRELTRALSLARSRRESDDALEPLVAELDRWQKAGLATVLVARGAAQADRLARLLTHHRVQVQRRSGARHRDAPPTPGSISVEVGTLSRAVVLPTELLALIPEEDIFGRRQHRPSSKSRSLQSLADDLRALAPGDYVVHREHGVGRYLGLERRVVDGRALELLCIDYQGGKLYLPVFRLDQIEKHAGTEAAPKLDRLGGQSFAKTKARIQRRVRQLADQLFGLYSERLVLQKSPLPAPDDDYAAFEATFPFEETPDQASAILDVLSDLESPKLMDRLVCGDVGYGKTEVALRAAFRTALAGRQVALLCPTTVLTQQHLMTFRSRLGPFGVEVRALSRFTEAGEAARTLEGLRRGTVDVVVGTHRLLSADVHFKQLGLLVVDEEHRFGVAHKERLKQLRASIDVLTLTATPIPRTLQLAIGGLRELSIMTTPPRDRRSIRTVIATLDSHLIGEAVRRELARGGQIFYVHHRIQGLEERAASLAALVPEARVAVAHGRMPKGALERTMLDFIEARSDVLACTSIIESGLDISRANTLIVDRADRFGLAQLYQLRGRVGRSSERAYCYLLVPSLSELTSEARSRLHAIERFADLGSGMRVASLDLELRGAGDVLGAEQSGMVSSVGFELFCQMLRDAADGLRGLPPRPELDPDLSLDVEALLPEEYVSDVGTRLSLYKRLAAAEKIEQVREIAGEIEDRFGPLPREAEHLVELMGLKAELRRLGILGCKGSATQVTFHADSSTPIDTEKLLSLCADPKRGYRLSPEARITRKRRADENFGSALQLAARAIDELSRCVPEPT